MKNILTKLSYIFLFALLVSCGNNNKKATTENSPEITSTKSEDKFIGTWENGDGIEMKISKLGETAFRIELHSIKYGHTESLTATLVNGNLETGGLNNVRIIYSDGKLIESSRTYEKVE